MSAFVGGKNLSVLENFRSAGTHILQEPVTSIFRVEQ